MAYNHKTLGLECLMDLLVTASTFTHLDFQQLINQVQPITRAMLATQGQNQVLHLNSEFVKT
jgi:hypothetical protein